MRLQFPTSLFFHDLFVPSGSVQFSASCSFRNHVHIHFPGATSTVVAGDCFDLSVFLTKKKTVCFQQMFEIDRA